MTGTSRIRPVLRWLVIALLLVQIAVPIAGLAGPRPARFGWQWWVRLFGRLDWLHALRFVPSTDVRMLADLNIPTEDADRALQLVRSGKREQGFRAVVGVLELTPVAFLWAPLLRLPPIAWLGDRVYGRVAERRHCSIAPETPT